jgi:hypothetical protein
MITARRSSKMRPVISNPCRQRSTRDRQPCHERSKQIRPPRYPPLVNVAANSMIIVSWGCIASNKQSIDLGHRDRAQVCKSFGFGLVWFGLVRVSFDASLEPQPRARKTGRLAEAALACHALPDKAEYIPRIPDPYMSLILRSSLGSRI